MAAPDAAVPATAAPCEVAGLDTALPVQIEVSFKGEKHMFALSDDATVGFLKEVIQERLSVSIASQKLLGLSKNPVADTNALCVLPLKRPHKVMLMGTRDIELLAAKEAALAAAESDGIVNDLEDCADEDEGAPEIHDNPQYHALIEKRITSYKPVMLEGFRPDTKTLVLDIDYTLLDHITVTDHPSKMMRPFLHEFLAIAYHSGWDIVIWSATNMRWIEVKMRETGISTSPDFKIAAFVDVGAMIRVKRHDKYVNVKPLGVVWGIFAEHCRKETTIMFDDLRRNFLMNPRHGLRISACHDLPHTRATDSTLENLSKYLYSIKDLPSFDSLNHRHWQERIDSWRAVGGEARMEREISSALARLRARAADAPAPDATGGSGATS
jgi:ubiquitin-like domain-containing CTD phosphatase 1